MTAWIVRAGVDGERDSWAIENGRAGGGFTKVPDLTDYESHAEMAEVAAQVWGGEAPGKIYNFAGQLWACGVASNRATSLSFR